MTKKQTKLFAVRMDDELERRVDEMKQRHNITSSKELLLTALDVLNNSKEPQIKYLEKIVEVEKSLPINSFVLEYSDKEFNLVNDINDMCQIQKWSKNISDLVLKLIYISHRRGEFQLTEQDYKELKEWRANKND